MHAPPKQAWGDEKGPDPMKDPLQKSRDTSKEHLRLT